jgi:catechol 2,3-dioxygenase-like lactoylglutathione lyase family enzyme
MINFKRANHIHICVPPERLEEARLFYADVLGLQQIERPNFSSAGYWFGIGDMELHIGVEAALPYTSRHTAFEITDVVAARKHLEKYGLKFLEEPDIAGRIRFSFIDPFGNRMELLQILD